jgi:hypothetical protein
MSEKNPYAINHNVTRIRKRYLEGLYGQPHALSNSLLALGKDHV